MIIKDDWMSAFCETNWYQVKDDISELPGDGDYLVEWRVSVRDHQKIAKAQSLGFELVETFVEFKSTVEPDFQTYHDVDFAKEEDLQDIINITNICLCENQKFYTRLKNTKYFSKEQCYLYYKLSVENNFHKSNNISVVLKDASGITGYYMLKKTSDGIYKGMMTGVLPRAKGKGAHRKMQRFIFNHIGQKVEVINTTQLNNFSIIRNHIIEGRYLSKIEHIFYKKA